MKKNYLRITLVTLAILILSIGIAMLSVTALGEEGIAVTSEEYVDILTPLSSEGGSIEDEIPSMEDMNVGSESVISPQDFSVITQAQLPDGVYALKNIGNGQRWMDMEQNHVSPGKHIQQYAYASSPADTFSRAGLFKISKKPGTTNQYIIRSMLNNRLSFCFTDDNCDEVITVKIAADDDAVQDKYTFTITYSTSGYVIKPYLEDYAISAPNSTASGSLNSYLTGQLISGINDRAKWEMQRYDGENQSGGYITSNKEIAKGLTVGTPYTLTIYGWTTLIGTNKIKLSVSSSYSDIVGGTWNSSTECLPLTVKKAAPFKIDVYMYNTTGSGETLVRSFYGNYMAVPPIEDGVNYFIQNMGTKRCMDVEGPSTAEGAIIQQWSFSTATQKKWIFTRESGGYFTIKSAYSNKYVGVDSTNTSVIRQYGTQSDYTKWYFESTESGRYAIYCKASAVTGVLALPSVSNGDGADLRIYAYTDDTNYRDEWIVTLLPCSGYEIKYEPDSWNYNPVKENTNCYAYALNNQSNLGDLFWAMQPGEMVGIQLSQSMIDAETVEELVKQDANAMGFVFERVERYEICDQGTYKVALVVDEGRDYHWYRQNPDGTWSHKRGGTNVIAYDASSKCIYNPETADRYYSATNNYDVFVGFFQVSPIDTNISAP